MPNQISLFPLQADDREQFIRDNQEAFNYGAMVEFGPRDNHFEEDGEIISRATIEESIDNGTAYRIIQDGKSVGGVIVKLEGCHGELEILFVSPKAHSKGIGYAAWCEIERMYPVVKVWETVTPYFEKRNIHFYVNRCGFHIKSCLRNPLYNYFPCNSIEENISMYLCPYPLNLVYKISQLSLTHP